MHLGLRCSARSLLIVFLFGLGACAEDRDPPKGSSGLPPDVPGEPAAIPGDGLSDFISDVPGESTGGNLAPTAEGADADGSGNEFAGADRAIAEADIIQLDGDRLYALSRYAGLHVIDVSDPGNLVVLGRYRINAQPFEMYLRGSVAYVMYNAYGRYQYDEAAKGYVRRESSRMQALNVANPANIAQIGSYDLAGNISDSRLVGDIAYVVTYENGYCFQCATKPNTRVTSFDIRDPSKFTLVDELRFEDPSGGYSWGPRSVSVTDQRMYVAGPHWDDRDGTIQVVDIADPTGDLKLGAEITIHGSIASRWQMDEYEGILRVVSQPRSWMFNDSPHVQTYRVEDSNHLVPLADLPIKLPRPETLQSARFDGTRGYVVTFERTDPLFTFDLSDPQAPVQLGELEIPGFLYHMEPRGNLLYALGFEQGNAAGGLHVSIFDVSDLTTPTLTSRVNFGGTWAHLAEDQDRVHKLFNLSLDQNLIMVPFGGGSYDKATCRYDYQSGIQLIDAVGTELTLRGVAPQIGEARRALLHRDRLFGVSDNAVQVFDISDRSAPRRIEQLEVARNIQHVKVLGDNVLRFGIDWWTSRAVLDVATPAGSEHAEGLGQLELTEPAPGGCYNWQGWDGRLFVHGNHAYVPRSGYAHDPARGYSTQHLEFVIVDLSNQSAPTVVGSFTVEPTDGKSWFGDILVTDSALLVGRVSGSYSYWQSGRFTYHYDIYDLANPAAPTFATRFEVPAAMAQGGWGYGAMGCGVDMYWGYWDGGSSALVDGDLVVSQHAVDINDGTKRVRYYLDRLDVSDPYHPELLTPINIPGQVVHFDADHQRAVTVSFLHREVPAVDWGDCYAQAYSAWFDHVAKRCNVYDRQVNVLSIGEDRATRISQLKLDGDRIATSVGVTSERVFYLTQERTSPVADERLESLSFASTGHLQRLPSLELEPSGAWFYGAALKARGTRAFVQRPGAMLVAQTEIKLVPTLTKHELPGWNCGSLEIGASQAFCAAGQFGVVRIPLAD